MNYNMNKPFIFDEGCLKSNAAECTAKVWIVGGKRSRFTHSTLLWALFVFIPFGIGYAFDNTAMQWIAFVGAASQLIFHVMMLIVLAYAKEKLIDFKRFASRSDAIKYLEGLSQ